MRPPALQPEGAALLAILLVACGGEPAAHRPGVKPASTPAPAPAAATEPPQSRLTIAVEVEPLHLCPLDDCDEWCWRIAQGSIFEPLARLGPDGSVGPSGLTSRFERSEDGTTYSFEIRPGARWHDGAPVTSSDVAATFERILHPRGGLDRLRRDLRDLRMVEIRGERTGRVLFDRAGAYTPAVLAEIPILPRAEVAWSGKGRAPDLGRSLFARRPVGSGPYRLGAWERGKKIVLRKVADYAGPPGTAGGGPGPSDGIDEIEFRIERDGAKALAMLRRGEIDLLPRVLPVHWPDQALTPAVRAGYREVRLRPRRYTVLLLNVRKPPLSDRRVRQAIAMLVDRPRLVRDARRGLGRLEFLALGDGELLPHDPDGAARLLEAAGLRDANGDGVRELAGVPPRSSRGEPWKLEVLHTARAPVVEEEIGVMRAGMRAAGVTLAGAPGEAADFESRLRRGAFAAALVSYATRREADVGDLVGTGGGSNFGGFSSPAIDVLVERLRRETSTDLRRTLWRVLAQRLREETPLVPLYATDEVGLLRNTVTGIEEGGDCIDLARLRLTGNGKNP